MLVKIGDMPETFKAFKDDPRVKGTDSQETAYRFLKKAGVLVELTMLNSKKRALEDGKFL